MSKERYKQPLQERTLSEKLLAAPRSLAWAVGAALATLVFGTLGLLVAMILPYRRRYALFIQWSFFLLWWARITCGIRYRVEGLENIPGKPCVVMCKHQSAWETLATQYWFTPQTWVLKRELMHIPLIGWALRLLAPIAIDRSARKAAMQQMLDQGRARLTDDRWVIVFPEGTRVAAGRCGRYRRGGAVLSAETGYPIVPIAHNAGEYWPRNSFLKYPGEIQIRIGVPIDPAGRDGDTLLEVVKEWIEENTRAISSVYESQAPVEKGRVRSRKDRGS